MTTEQRCGGTPGQPGIMPRGGDEGTTRWYCPGCTDCRPPEQIAPVTTCVWDDSGFAPVCSQPEEAHCPFGSADDECRLLHHPFKAQPGRVPSQGLHEVSLGWHDLELNRH